MVYNFLERPNGKMAFLYHGCVFIAVFFCLSLSIFATIGEGKSLNYAKPLVLKLLSA